MKKTASFILAVVILVMSAFSVNAFAQEQTNENGISEAELDAWLSYNGDTPTYAKMFFKGSNFACETENPLAPFFGSTVKLILKDGKCFLSFPAIPFLHFEYEGEEFALPELNDIEPDGMIFVKTEEIVVDNTTYRVDEYVDSYGATIKIYYEDDRVLKIESAGYDEDMNYSESTLKIISYEVDDSVFEIPRYSINITPFLGFIIDLEI